LKALFFNYKLSYLIILSKLKKSQMCSLDLYNWYENRYPNDFKNLIKIKHYSISDLSFLLSKVWCKLDYGEKLLMCAIYYDDFDLAKQMLDETLMFRVNPFFGKRYFTNMPFRTYLSSSGSSCTVNYSSNNDESDSNNSCDVFNDNNQYTNNKTKSSHKFCSKDPSSPKNCWCLNEINILNTRTSFSSYTNFDSVLNESDEQSTEARAR
jgi:hypothetical protein